jgi:hypothetical protein
VEEHCKQPSIQAVIWLLLSAFSQIYSENRKQKSKTEGVLKIAVWPEKEHM